MSGARLNFVRLPAPGGAEVIIQTEPPQRPRMPDLAVLTAAGILAGYVPWWLPPAVSPDDIRRGMLGSTT